jgi:dihydrofolate reductase|tara:strand:+ start:2486 stop:3373 length:888 start_codon:yes stop_codon:yes gene_type:complete
MQDQHELYEYARSRTKQKKRLYLHFVVFIVGSVFLFVLNKVLNIGEEILNDWFIWAILLWSFFWILHFINVFVTNRFMGKEWERKQTEKLVAKQEKRITKIKKRLEKETNFKAESEFYTEQKRVEPKKNDVVKKQTITLIAAIANDNALGKDNDLIWHLPADLKRFKTTTSGHHIIMGRNTYESIGKPLPNRTSVIITRNPDYKAEGCIVVNSLDEALKVAKNDDAPFIIGGAQIYKEAVHYADKLDITEVHQSFEADVYFPEINTTIWQETSREDFAADEKNKYDYSFVTYEKK